MPFPTTPADPAASTAPATPAAPGGIPSQPVYNDVDLLKLFEQAKRECFDQRWIFERQWLRNIYYMLGRQWIFYNSKRGEWQDKRLAKWIPRPVTNKCKEGVQAIRAMFTSIKNGVNARPNGQDPKNVTTASVADELSPLLHEEHEMNTVMQEGDWWFIVTGNVFYHTYWDYDRKYGVTTVTQEQCQGCQNTYPSNELTGSQPVCPDCGGTEFAPAMDPTGQPVPPEELPKGKGCTVALSPLEIAFPFSYARFKDVPFLIRLRWRHKQEYEQYPELAELVKKIQWQKQPSERSLQLFKSLPLQNDLGTMPFAWSAGPTTTEDEGVVEYELWVRPNATYPQGLVVRVAGDASPQIVHLEGHENVPGPLPYTDAEGNGIFTFTHATYEHVGGRILGSGAIDPIITKQDQLNQLDSMQQMIIQRMANPIWLEPKGAEIEKFTGEPGLVVKWNPLTVGGQAEPKRIPGEGPHASFFQIREQYLSDIEQLMGTFDIVKGAKPTGVEAFSALQLLVERSQARFASAFQARGDAYRDWFKFALELERQFGPEERTKAVLTSSRGYAFKTFKTAQLGGSITIVVEDGSTTPKTSLGHRAAVEHLNQLGVINAQDPDQKYEILRSFGETKLVPSLDIHVQSALQKQQAFEEWVANPGAVQQAGMLMQQQQQQDEMQVKQAMAMGQPPPPMPSPMKFTPLALKKWYDPIIHKQEFLKWANSDRIRELLKTHPEIEGLLEAHLAELDIAMQEAMMPIAPPMGQDQGQPGAPPAGPPGGAGAAMSNSNKNSASLGSLPKGNKQTAQNQGPA